MKKLLSLLLAFLFIQGTVLAQKSITGKVTDEKGVPVSNATILIKGTNIGTSSKTDGTFQLKVPANARTLVVSSVGNVEREISITSSNNYNISLSSVTADLSEVVVVGYGTAKRKDDVAGSLTKIDGKVVESKPTANLLDNLQGKVPGLQVYTSSGEPSATSSVRLHGVGSLGASNTPLYVLDGVQVGSGTIVSLNPNDIASITVLKDPSTTAIYGSRAASGVILYTTKQGRANNPTLSISTQYGVSSLIKETEDLFNSFLNTKQLTDFWIATGYRTQAQVDGLLALYNADTKWYKSYYKETAPTFQADLSLSGGGGKTTYYVSGGYFKQEGLTYRSDFERATFRSNITSTVKDWLKFGLNLSGGVDIRQENPYGSNSTNRGLALLAQPFYSPVDSNGVKYPNLIPGWGRYNPEYLANNIKSDGKNVQFNPNVFVEFSPIKNLVLRSQMGMDAYDYTSTEIRLPSYIGSLNNGSRGESFSRGVLSTITNTGEYKFKVKSDNDFTILVGQEYIKSKTKNFSGSSTGQSDDRLLEINAGPSNRDASSSLSEYAYQSYFSRLNYAWKSKIYADVSVRQDQSSRFGKDNRKANFWSGGILYKIKKESFMQNLDWLTDLSLRASYGTSGNSSIGNYENLATVSNLQYAGQTGFGISSPGNPQLGWENQTQTTVGIDATFLKKIYMTLDFYNRETGDQLFNQPFPYTSGFSTIKFNAGSIRNRGVDLGLSADVYKSRKASITPFISLNYNKNEVTELFQGRDYYVVPNTGVSYVIGQPVSYLYPIFAGVDPQTGLPTWFKPNADPTKFVYGERDPNNVTSVFSSADLQQGTGIQRYAPFNGGFGLDATYDGFYLNANFSFSSGKYLINNDRYFFENPSVFAGFNQSVNVLDYWKKPGDITKFPKYGEQFTQFDSRLIEDASFMRLKGLTVGYSVPTRMLDRLKVIKGIDVSVTGRNLLTFTNYSGPDPEVDSNLSLGANPNTKQVVVGAKFRF